MSRIFRSSKSAIVEGLRCFRSFRGFRFLDLDRWYHEIFRRKYLNSTFGITETSDYMPFRIIAFLIFPLVFISCNSQKNDVKSDKQTGMTKIELNDIHSLKEYLGKVDSLIFRGLSEQLNDKYLVNKDDRQLFRICRYDLNRKSKLVVIRENANRETSVCLIDFSTKFSQEQDSFQLVVNDVICKRPSLEGTKIKDSLLKLNILTLPDCRTLKGYDHPADSDNFEVEIFAGDSAVKYEYTCPEANRNFESARQMIKIANFIESSYGFKGFGYLK